MDESPFDSRLLEYLRERTDTPELEYASPPKALIGGLSGASISAFELSNAPPELDGPLVLRMLVGDDVAARQLREVALQDAAGRLGANVPRVRMLGSEQAGLGGPFFIMDRLSGRPLLSWLAGALAIGVGMSIIVGDGRPLAAAWLLGSTLVGVTMARHQRRVQALPLEEVRAIYREHGVPDAGVEYEHLLNHAESVIAEAGLDGCEGALHWLREHRVVPARPMLCHGDVQPVPSQYSSHSKTK